MIKNFIIKEVDGFEPTIKLLQSRALPLGYTATTIPLYNRMVGFVKIGITNFHIIFLYLVGDG